MANKYVKPEYLEKLAAKNDEFLEMLLREMNTNTWTPSSDGRKKGKDRVILSLTMITKLQSLMEGSGKAAAINAERYEKELKEKDAKEQAAFAMKEAAKIAQRMSKH